MKDEAKASNEIPASPLALEGYAILHQMFRVRRANWRALESEMQDRVVTEAASLLGEMAKREDGESACFSQLGHKGDLMLVHFRRSFEELNAGRNRDRESRAGRLPRTYDVVSIGELSWGSTRPRSRCTKISPRRISRLIRRSGTRRSKPSSPVNVKRSRRASIRKSRRAATYASIRWTRSARATTTGTASLSSAAAT